jgi:hypothetical protein
VILFLSYAVGIASLLWYTLFYLPFGAATQHFGFALNLVEMGFLSLLSFLVYRQEDFFRSVFFQFWLLYAYLALIPALVYSSFYFLGNSGGIDVYVESLFVLHGLFIWVSAKILLTYWFRDEKTWVLNIVSILVVLPLCMWVYWPYWWSPQILATLPTATSPDTFNRPIEQKLMVTNGVSLLLLVAFFVHKLRTDRPIGVYADTLLFLFAIWILIDTAEFVAKASLDLMNMTQWASAAVAAAMIGTLLLRLKFKTQTIAHYYESQCLSGDPRIDRRIGRFDRLIVRYFFDPEKVGQRVFLGPGTQKMKVKRSSLRVTRSVDQD